MTHSNCSSCATGPTFFRDVDRDVDAMIRGLSMDFPLHSASELRRTIMDAFDDIWPRKDPIDVLDRARVRLQGA